MNTNFRGARAALAAIALAALASACASPATSVAAAPSGSSERQVAPRSAASAPAPAAAPAAGNVGTIERMPQVVACKPRSRPMLMGSGPGQETYSVICGNGYGLLVQCVSGECKVMN